MYSMDSWLDVYPILAFTFDLTLMMLKAMTKL